MNQAAGGNPQEPRWISDFVRAEPRAPLMVPYLAYLALLAINDIFPSRLIHVSIVIHTAAALWVAWVFRHHLPPMGKAHWGVAVLAGLGAAWLWVAGQHFLDEVNLAGWRLGGRLPFYPGEAKAQDPTAAYGTGAGFWAYATLKIGRACTAVPVVEELFWRGFILRAFVRWDHYDQVEWGRFHWRAFLGSALLSTVQHPDNWGVSILCWLGYNLLFYWKKSLLCLVVAHAATNLTLYSYVIYAGDWRFW
jgi:CAAX prenyl protease-like protein